MSNPNQVRVHSRVLDCGRPDIPLWYFSRWLDFDGSGRVEFTVEQACEFFGNSPATIYRQIKQGEGVLWHRDKKIRGSFVLYLVGIRQVCRNLHLGCHKNVLGAIADVPAVAIATRFGAKALATQLDALQCQRQAWWAASQSVPEGIRNFILKPWEKASLVKSTGDSGENKGTKQIDRYAFESGDWSIPGATIAGIRKRTGWKSDRTIQRRPSTKVRAEHGLGPVGKKRVVQEVTSPDLMTALAQSCSGYVVENNRVYKVLKFTGSKFFALKHNIYAEDFELLGLRRLRGKVNRDALNDIST
ncbi:MAG: hypothetical protein AAGA46_00445 [Cyanobacteria bacterium P01_F01_bin.13]